MLPHFIGQWYRCIPVERRETSLNILLIALCKLDSWFVAFHPSAVSLHGCLFILSPHQLGHVDHGWLHWCLWDLSVFYCTNLLTHMFFLDSVQNISWLTAVGHIPLCCQNLCAANNLGSWEKREDTLAFEVFSSLPMSQHRESNAWKRLEIRSPIKSWPR